MNTRNAKGNDRGSKRRRKARPLVVERLEMVSKALFKKYYPLITDLIGSSHGIYALYSGSELYYVGKSIDLRKRVRAHLRDRHLASWSHFSLYLVRNADHLNEIESLLIRIANPKGNRLVPKGRGNAGLRKKLRALIKQRHREELAELLDRRPGEASKQKAAMSAGKKAARTRQSLRGLVSKRTKLYRTYKGKELHAVLTPAGSITWNGKKYASPTAAAKAATGRNAVNGWEFWYMQDDNGDWVRLSEFRP